MFDAIGLYHRCMGNLLWAFLLLFQTAPTDGQGWFNQGLAQHTAGQYDDAIRSFQRAIELQFNVPGSTMRVARAYSKKGDAAAAIEWLGRAGAAGFAVPQFVESDPDFETARRHAGYAAALQKINENFRPCAFREDYKGFQFWVGEWDVLNPAGRKIADSRIESTLDGCVIVENWFPLGAGPGQGSGKSWNVFDGQGKWRQTYVSDNGSISDFEGAFQGNALVFLRSFTRAGTAVNVRMTFTPSGENRVRQLIEQSTDGGENWMTQFDGDYQRKP